MDALLYRLNRAEIFEYDDESGVGEEHCGKENDESPKYQQHDDKCIAHQSKYSESGSKYDEDERVKKCHDPMKFKHRKKF